MSGSYFNHYQMCYAALIFALSEMHEILPGYRAENPNYRRALDDSATSEDAPLALQYKRTLDVSHPNPHYRLPLAKAIKLVGSLEIVLNMQFLAHTCPRFPYKNLQFILDQAVKEGYDISRYSYPRIKIKAVRMEIEEKLEDIPKRASTLVMHVTPIRLDEDLLDDEDKALTKAWSIDSDLMEPSDGI